MTPTILKKNHSGYKKNAEFNADLRFKKKCKNIHPKVIAKKYGGVFQLLLINQKVFGL